MNILRFKIFNKVLLSKWFLYVLQFITLLIFLFLMYFGWETYPLDGYNDKLFAKTHIVNQTIWAIWWPLMIWITVIFGRIWCMICPMELLSNVMERIGKKLKLPQYNYPFKLKNGILILVIYFIVQLSISGFHIHRIPAFTSYFLLSLISLAILSGLLYKNRAFCSMLCPVGMLLNLYGRLGLFSVRSDKKNLCITCDEMECVKSSYRDKFDKRSCPSLLNPSSLSSNADCLYCMQCSKSCQSSNMNLNLGNPFKRKENLEKELSLPITLFIILLFGFVTYELTTEWKAAKEVFLYLPTYLSSFLPQYFSGFLKGIWTLVIFPVTIWILFGMISKLAGNKTSLINIWRTNTLTFILLLAAGHMTKGIAKLSSWIVYFPEVIKNPSGYETMYKFQAGILNTPEAILSKPVISIIGLLVLFIAFLLTNKVFIYSDTSSNKIINLQSVLIFVFYGFLIFGIGFIN